MKLDPDEKELLDSIARGDWKPIAGDEVVRMRVLARQQLRLDVHAGFDVLARGEGHSHDAASGPRLARRITARSRTRRAQNS
jgi:hypothetical protein